MHNNTFDFDLEFLFPTNGDLKPVLSHVEVSKIGGVMKHIIGLVVTLVTLASCGAVATAQQPAKIPRIGFQLDSSPSAVSARLEAFRQGLRELGYVEGKNIVIEWRSAEGKPDRRSELAAD